MVYRITFGVYCFIGISDLLLMFYRIYRFIGQRPECSTRPLSALRRSFPRGRPAKSKFIFAIKILSNPSFAMEIFDGSSFPIKFNVCDIHSGHHFTNPDGKVCDNILERRHTSHWLRKVVLSGVALKERVVSFGTSQQEMGHKGKILLAQYIMW